MTSSNPQHNAQALLRDERGALLVMGIFMMLILVSMLYMLIGVGQTLQAREGMQDAADAAAFTSAVFLARGMNLIALINQLMAMLVAILVAIRLAETFMAMSSATLFSLAWFYGITVPGATACQQAAQQLGNAYDNAKDPIMEALEVMHEVQEATSVLVPFVAFGAGALEAAKDHPPALGAFPLPGAISLPVESDEFSVLCGRATQEAITGSVEHLTGFIPLPEGFEKAKDIALEPINAAAQGIGASLSGYLCGAGNSKPPPFEHKVDKGYPQIPGIETCEEDPKGSRCDPATQDLNDAKPNETTGECAHSYRCGYDDPYEHHARMARSQCSPAPGFFPYQYNWQEATVDSVWVYRNEQWVEQSHSIDETSYKYKSEDPRPPCGPGGTLNKKEWNIDSGPRSQDEPDFLCAQEINFLSESAMPLEGQRVEKSYKVALRIFSCVTKETKLIEIAEDGESFGSEGSGDDSEGSGDDSEGNDGGDDSEDKSPHRVDENVELGDEAFQIRAISFGPEVGPGYAQKGVEVSLLGRKTNERNKIVYEVGQTFSRFSIAQAEYYFDGDKGDKGAKDDKSSKRKDWLWEMNWRARLVRVRMPSDDDEKEEGDRQQENSQATTNKLQQFGVDALNDTLGGICEKVSDFCPTESDISIVTDLVIH